MKGAKGGGARGGAERIHISDIRTRRWIELQGVGGRVLFLPALENSSTKITLTLIQHALEKARADMIQLYTSETLSIKITEALFAQSWKIQVLELLKFIIRKFLKDSLNI